METTMNDETESSESVVAVPVAAPANPAEKRTAEEWAKHRGHLPEIRREAPPKEKPKKVMPAIHNPDFRHYQGARFLSWGGLVGKEVTLEEYDAAVKAAAVHAYR